MGLGQQIGSKAVVWLHWPCATAEWSPGEVLGFSATLAQGLVTCSVAMESS